jgi:hypothetical protein
MKRFVLFLVNVGLAASLAGCASDTVAPVGPNPDGSKGDASTGQLQVFSRMATRDDDQNQAGDGIPVWHQYTAYSIYDENGNLVKRVANSSGHYGRHAQVVTLPAGNYLVKAQAKDYYWVKVPVNVLPGEMTKVHLDDNWRPPGEAPKGDVVYGPDGNPIGWRSNSQ